MTLRCSAGLLGWMFKRSERDALSNALGGVHWVTFTKKEHFVNTLLENAIWKRLFSSNRLATR